jgi:alpha-ketoglutarate-dependent taurine dioxygenase
MSQLEIRKLDAPYGAEVLGLDPTAAPDDETRKVLSAAFYEHGVLLFSDVEFDFAEQQRLAETLVGWGPDEWTETEPGSAGNYISNREENATSATGKIQYHTDGMWSDEPFDLVSLYAMGVDPDAAPTTFASMGNGWDLLPADLKARVADLHVVQGEGHYAVPDGEELEEYSKAAHEGGHSRVTPLAMPHPKTGRTLLYITEQQTRSIVELPGDEGVELLHELFGHLYSPENVTEHTWTDGEFVAWDNIGVQHGRGNVSYEGPARTLRRSAVPPGWMWAQRWYNPSASASA